MVCVKLHFNEEVLEKIIGCIKKSVILNQGSEKHIMAINSKAMYLY